MDANADTFDTMIRGEYVFVRTKSTDEFTKIKMRENEAPFLAIIRHMKEKNDDRVYEEVKNG